MLYCLGICYVILSKDMLCCIVNDMLCCIV